MRNRKNKIVHRLVTSILVLLIIFQIMHQKNSYASEVETIESTEETQELVVPKRNSRTSGAIEVKASSTQTNYQTYTDPVSGLRPGALRISLVVDIKEAETTDMYIEIPHNFNPPESFEFRPHSVGPEEAFFSFNQTASESGVGYMAYVDSYDTSDPTKLRIKLKDGLSTGQTTLNLYYDFNMNYDAIIPANTILWEFSAKVVEGSTIPVYTDSKLLIKTPAGNGSSRLWVGHNRIIPQNEIYVDGNLGLRTFWRNDNPQHSKMDPNYESIIYLDLPAGWSPPSNLTSYLDKIESLPNGTTRYYKIVGGPTVTDESILWDSWNFNGVIGDCFTSININFSPPSGLLIDDTFEFVVGARYKKTNSVVITEENRIDYKVSEQQQQWGLSLGLRVHRAIAGGRVYSLLQPDSVSEQIMHTGFHYEAADTFKNIGTEDITGVRKEIYQTSLGSARTNFDTVMIRNTARSGSTPAKYQVIFDVVSGGNINKVVRGVDEVIFGVPIALPILLEGEYISKITVVPMGISGNDEGHLPPDNGLTVQYRHRAWPSEKWPDGTPVDNAIIDMEWTVYYNDEYGNARTMVSNNERSKLYYGTENSVDAEATMISNQALVGVNPGDTVTYDILGYNSNRVSENDWKNPIISIRVPKFMELQGSTFNLVDKQTGSDVVKINTVTVNRNSDENYNYYQFKYIGNDYIVSPGGAIVPAFSIPVTFKIVEGTPPGTTSIETLVVSSRDTASFRQMTQPTNNLSVSEASLYGFIVGDNYSKPSLDAKESTSITINSNALLRTVSQMKSEGTGNTWVIASSEPVPANYDEIVEMKATITNAGNSIYSGIKVFNILPTNGDSYGSTGSIEFESVDVLGARVYYSTRPIEELGITYASNINNYNPGLYPEIWTETKPINEITAIFVVYPETSKINPTESFDIVLKFKIPKEEEVNGIPQTVFNQFKYSAMEEGTGTILNPVSAKVGFSTEATLLNFKENKPSILGSYTEVTGMPENVSGLVGAGDLEVAEEEPSLYGYEFKGWTRNEIGSGQVYESGDRFAFELGDSNLTIDLYAKWEAKEITVNFDVNVGEGANPESKKLRFGVPVTVGDIPEPVLPRAGYDFEGWSTIAGTTNTNYEVGYQILEEGSITVYGVWKARNDTEYTVKHWQKNIGSTEYTEVLSDQEIKTGTTGEIVVETNYQSNTYEGFTYNESLTSPESKAILPDGSLEINLYYDRNTYEVRYEYEGVIPEEVSNLPTEVTYEYGETITLEPNATAIGYTFSGWKIEGTIVEDSFVMPAGNITITGGFTAEGNTGYQVEHYIEDLMVGTYTLIETENLTGETGSEVVYAATILSGFTYDKSKDEWNNGSIQPIIKGDGSLVIKLYYTRNSYEVRYEIIGEIPTGMSSLKDEVSVRHGETVEVTLEATAPGYEFTGWKIEGTEAGESFIMPIDEVIITGSFLARTDTRYTVVHKVKDIGTDTYSVVETEILEGITDQEAIYTDQEIEGFTYNESLTSQESKAIAGDGSLVIELYYTRNRYKVIYEYEGEVPEGVVLPTEESIEYGASVLLKPNTIAKGYTFSGWKIEGTLIEDNFVMPAEDIELKGSWMKVELGDNINNINTGDEKQIELLVVMSMISVMSIILIIVKRKKENKMLS